MHVAGKHTALFDSAVVSVVRCMVGSVSVCKTLDYELYLYDL